MKQSLAARRKGWANFAKVSMEFSGTPSRGFAVETGLATHTPHNRVCE